MPGLRTLNSLWPVLLAGCVTINVYFPAAAAEKAADRIIEDVWGEEPPAGEQNKPGEPAVRGSPGIRQWIDFLIPAARAADPNIDISSPAIQAIKASMKDRHQHLEPFYVSGAVGLTADGLLAVRDPSAAALRERQKLNGLVTAENRDRDALYREIARANGHPEWESSIRSTFARRWVDKAPGGWWMQSGGQWQRK